MKAAMPEASGLGAKLELLGSLRSDVEGCRLCELSQTRINVVFGSGNPDARVMIVGEAPGKREDETGCPFVGAAGKYLDELLSIAGLSRDEVFIANVLKCRPPSNRDPKPDEIVACAPYLRQQARIVDPELIVTLGNFATRFILRTEVGITSLRGKVHATGKFKVLPVFHPAAALYDVKKRPVLEADFAYLGTVLGS